MDIKIIVLDLDGTLTNKDKIITEKTKQALMKAQQENVTVVLASGRPTCGIVRLAEELELAKYNGYILSYNGGKIIDCGDNDKVVYEKNLPYDMICRAYDLAKKYNLSIMSYNKDVVITESPDDEFVNIEASINKTKIQKVDNFKEYVKFNVIKCLVVGNGDYLATVEEDIKNQMGDNVNVFRSEPFFLEVMPQNIDKAYSLTKLLDAMNEKNGTSLTKENIMACGDGFNDLSMIKFAGLGVAMENAQDIVKESADFVTLSNNDDGVAHVIEKFVFK